ncbi:Fumarylacetoacetate hydrolase domain-containing protein 2 [Thelohanellus kitauei]|uniref:oxaloacetate tautomerase n=1 Tax=Thelohanellus kitauei TaxID=669202 RepID=A0A0C2JF21_THEKT|nr:Fumarylacetoacetate hydrolase domain-containing protein 2 [Thelohanellus kitauei]
MSLGVLKEIKKDTFELFAFRKDGVDSLGYWRTDLSKIVDLKPLCKNLGLDTSSNFKNPKDLTAPGPQHPIIFSKPANTITGPNESTRLPSKNLVINSLIQKTVIEGELAIIIGSHAKDVKIEHAADYIFGFTTVNDITDKSEFFDCHQYPLTHGKYMDGYLPCASRILVDNSYGNLVTYQDFSNKIIKTSKNDDVIQEQTTGDMIFDIPTLISRITIITLEPGDCIMTGTPVYKIDPPDIYIQAGDVVQVQIEGLQPITSLILEKDQPKH